MTITRLMLLLAALPLGACNPLDPGKIEKQQDKGVTQSDGAVGGCQPACGAGQVCLTLTAGGCDCFSRCDDNLCTVGGSCIADIQGNQDCFDLTQLTCP